MASTFASREYHVTPILPRIALAAAVLLGGSAFAALPNGTISYLEPSGTAGPHDTIYVALRFTLDPEGEAFSYTDGNLLAALDPADLPTEGWYYGPGGAGELRAFDRFDSDLTRLSTYFVCNDTFTGGCNGDTSNYRYSFNTFSLTGQPDVFPSALSLQPGQYYDYVFAYFIPAAGGAAPGEYTYYNTGVTIQFYGYDVDGNSLYLDVDLAGNYGDSFTRTVTAVPEPATWAMMAAGAALLGAAARRRRKQQQAE